MHQRLTTEQIEAVCGELLRSQRWVGVRDVARLLRQRHGASGRTERIAAVLRREVQRCALPSPTTAMAEASDVTALREKLQLAENRAERAEEMERRHQDFWAARYADKVQELEQRYAAQPHPPPGVTADQYLKVCQLNSELAQRLAEYEPATARRLTVKGSL